MWRLLRRIRTAAAILFLPGDRTPVTKHDLVRLKHDWQEWEITFNGILEKLNAWQARQAKREKRELVRSLEASEGPQQPTGSVRKLELYRRARAMGGGRVAPPTPDLFEPEPDEAE